MYTGARGAICLNRPRFGPPHGGRETDAAGAASGADAAFVWRLRGVWCMCGALKRMDEDD
jgi:hypothetical protein